jgi:hypothetical protein
MQAFAFDFDASRPNLNRLRERCHRKSKNRCHSYSEGISAHRGISPNRILLLEKPQLDLNGSVVASLLPALFIAAAVAMWIGR